MNQIARIGLDIAKRWFQVHAVDSDGREVLNRKLPRDKVLGVLAALSPCDVALEACRPSKPTFLPENHLAKGSVSIYSDYASHARLLFVQRTGAAGYTTTTDSRSRRNRASRRGGQLVTRARSSTSKDRPARTFVLPAPLSRMVTPYAAIQKPQPDIGAGTLIPVTNAIERLHEEFKRRIKTQTVLPCAETAAMLFWALLASGQITIRKVDGWQTIAEKPSDQIIDPAA